MLFIKSKYIHEYVHTHNESRRKGNVSNKPMHILRNHSATCRIQWIRDCDTSLKLSLTDMTNIMECRWNVECNWRLSCFAGERMDKFMRMLKDKDTTLWLKLQEQDLKPQYYAFRWITLLLSQEFDLPGLSLLLLRLLPLVLTLLFTFPSTTVW